MPPLDTGATERRTHSLGSQRPTTELTDTDAAEFSQILDHYEANGIDTSLFRPKPTSKTAFENARTVIEWAFILLAIYLLFTRLLASPSSYLSQIFGPSPPPLLMPGS